MHIYTFLGKYTNKFYEIIITTFSALLETSHYASGLKWRKSDAVVLF